jgi:hypothetical protein
MTGTARRDPARESDERSIEISFSNEAHLQLARQRYAVLLQCHHDGVQEEMLDENGVWS